MFSPKTILSVGVMFWAAAIAVAQDSEPNLTASVGDPCEGNAADHIVWYYDDRFYTPSFYEKCIESLPLRSIDVTEHIYALNGSFAEYYAFYHITKDPATSFPSEHQPELGYSIFSTEAEGKVDIAGRINEIHNDAYYNANNATVFWAIDDVFTDLRDAHVVLPAINQDFGGILQYMMLIVPDRALSEEYTFRPEFSLAEDGTFELKMIWKNKETGKLTFTLVESLGGVSVTDYVLYMANTRAKGLANQALGARINKLMKSPNFVPRDYDRWAFGVSYSTRPSSVLPDEFEVIYTNGDKGTWYVKVFTRALGTFLQTQATASDPDAPLVFDRSGLELLLTEPGKAWANYDSSLYYEDVALSEIYDTTPESSPRVMGSRTVKQPPPVDGLRFYSCDSCVAPNGALLAAYAFQDDYAILKIEDFAILPGTAVEIWRELVEVSRTRGISKLMVDISGNGGGYVQGALAFIILMHPYTDYGWFQSNGDLNYNNQMQVYAENIYPLLDGLESRVASLSDLEMVDLVVRFDKEVSALYQLPYGLWWFCKESCALDPNKQDQADCECREHLDLLNAGDTFLNDLNATAPMEQTLQSYRDMLTNLTHFIREVNPWTVTQGGSQLLQGGSEEVTDSVIRGGTQYYLTDYFDFLEKSCTPTTYAFFCYDDIRNAALDLDFQFDQYILVSDGTGGSSTSIFAAGMEQIWKNRDRSFANTSVVTVAYGGSGDPQDITLAGFPASVEHVRIENPLLTRTALVLFRTLLLDYFNLQENQAVHELLFDAIEKFTSTLYWPPYFGDSLPYIPVINYYDTFMGRDALPLQYVKMPPDEYIPKLFTQVSFSEREDLISMYNETAVFFERGGTAISRKNGPRQQVKKASGGDFEDKAEGGRTFEEDLAELLVGSGAVGACFSGVALLVALATSLQLLLL